MLHDCPPPIAELQRWLRSAYRESDNYAHALFEENATADNALLAALRPYFESAHLDARDVFHRAARIDLHPDADGDGSHAQYPGCLPPTAIKGLFGEVMAGLMVEAFRFVGHHTWSIPIYLFRYHTEVQTYIFNLARNPDRVRQVSGRHGNDFIALGIEPGTGEVVRFIAGEAKWRAALTPSVIDGMMLGDWTGPADERVRSGKGVWNDINTSIAVPEGLEQICQMLRDRSPDDHAETILSLDRALMIGAVPLPRTDYVFVAGNRAAGRADGQSYLRTDAPPEEYLAGRPLQIVELVVGDGASLIDKLYSSLWSD